MADDERLIPTEEWHPVPVADSAEYLDRDAPTYLDGEHAPEGGRAPGEPLRLRSADESSERMRQFVETNGYLNSDGTTYAPAELPDAGEAEEPEVEEG